MQTNKRRWRRPRDKLADFFFVALENNKQRSKGLQRNLHSNETRECNEGYTAEELGTGTKDTQLGNEAYKAGKLGTTARHIDKHHETD